VRDQNLKQTTINIYQLLSEHKFSDKDILKLGGGYNFIDAREPNRIRNEVNIFGENDIRFGNRGNFQQRKSAQIIQDTEWNAFAKYTRDILDTDDFILKANIGVNYRDKQRKFDSRFDGFRLAPSNRGFSVNSFDNLDEAFTEQNIGLGIFLPQNGISAFYDGELLSKAGFISADIKIADIVSAKIGVRYEDTDVNIPIFNVPNRPQGNTAAFNSNKNFLPSFTVKVDVLDNLAIKAAASKTVTLQEFKELAPFEYVSPNGRVTRGNEQLKPSENLNGDLKIEFYPKDGQLISLTGFAKRIEDPINKTLTRGSSGVFSYFNTSDEAKIQGLEFEARLDLFDLPDQAKLSTNFNLTRMWHKQDLKPEDLENNQFEEFRYGNKTEIGLQGASDWIVNSSFTFSNNKENEFLGTLTANYSSDKILALGRANEARNFRTAFNNEIIEKGFLTLDLVLSKKFNEHLTVKLINKNLIDPEIRQTQLIEPPTTSTSSEETVLSFRKGRSISLGLSYKF